MPDKGRDEAFDNELRSLVTAGHRAEAVKRYRERTGTGSKDAADAVGALTQQQGISQRELDMVEWDVIALLERGQKTQAVTFYRERVGSGLKEAQDAVARIVIERNISGPRGAGCFSFVALAVAALLCAVLAAA